MENVRRAYTMVKCKSHRIKSLWDNNLIIDNSYCGSEDQWKMPVLAIEDTVIHKGDRICQFRIVKSQPKIRFIESDLSGNENRGGFGSTGVQ